MQLGCTRSELLDRISSRELTEWMAFAQLEPFGSEAYYLGHAIVAHVIANVNRGKGQREYKVGEFMPKFDDEPQSRRTDDAICANDDNAMGGEDVHSGG